MFLNRILPLLLACSSLSTFAQTKVDTVIFTGVKRNKINYLNRFVKCKPNSSPTLEWIKKDEQALRNLPSIYAAQGKIVDTLNQKALIFDCEESFTILPIFNAGFGGGNESFWFQIGALDHNFLGRGVQLQGFYQYKEKHTFSSALRIPYLHGSKWGISLQGKKWTTNEPLYFGNKKILYQYDNYYGELVGIREFSYNHYIEFGGAIFQENYTKLVGQSTDIGPQKATLDKYLYKLNYIRDRINYFYFYQSGYAFKIFTTKVLTVQYPNDNFDQLTTYLSYFERIKHRGNLALRLQLGISTNNNSPFSPYVLDSQTNIRGIGDRVRRGTSMYALNSEYRHTLLSKKFFAFQGVSYLDLGGIRQPGYNFSQFMQLDELNIYAGGGVRIILKKVYNAVLRIDYGYDIKSLKNGGFTVGFGHYF